MMRDNNLVPCMEGIERVMSREEGEIRGAPEEGQTQEDAGEDQAKAGWLTGTTFMSDFEVPEEAGEQMDTHE